MKEDNKKSFPVEEVSGTPIQMGESIGESQREILKNFYSITLDRINEGRGGDQSFKDIGIISIDFAKKIAKESVVYVEEYSPDILEEIKGISNSSGLKIWEVMLLNIRNQLGIAFDSGCTSVGVSREKSQSGNNIIGQNWDNDPELDKFSLVLIRRPKDKPDFISFTQPGLMAYIGFNDEGLGICMNALMAPGKGSGVPWYFIVRKIFEQNSYKNVIKQVVFAKRAIPANAFITTTSELFDLEITDSQMETLFPDSNGVLIHTNHCVHPKFSKIAADYPDLIESKARFPRAQTFFDRKSERITSDDFKNILMDHEEFPRSICRHENEHPETGFWTTTISVIIDPSENKMDLTRGNPCSNEYVTYKL